MIGRMASAGIAIGHSRAGPGNVGAAIIFRDRPSACTVAAGGEHEVTVDGKSNGECCPPCSDRDPSSVWLPLQLGAYGVPHCTCLQIPPGPETSSTPIR